MSEQRRTDLRESQLTNRLNPSQLVEIWNQEKPWETPPHPKGVKGWFGRSGNPPRVRSYDRDDRGRTEHPDYVHAGQGSGRNEYDVRGWILSKLGLSDKIMNQKVITATKAHELIAKGLGISRFQAAIIDHATRSVPHEEIDEMFKLSLLRPEEFIPRRQEEKFSDSALTKLAAEMSKLNKDDWTTMGNALKDGWEYTPEYVRYRELERNPDIRNNVYMYAFRDVVSGEIEEAGGDRYHPLVHEFPIALAVFVSQGEMHIENARQTLNKMKIATMQREEAQISGYPDATYSSPAEERKKFNDLIGREFPDET